MHSPKLNWLLALLPEADYDKLLPHLELVGLDSGKVLFQTGQKDTPLYFPTTCTISAQIQLDNGNTTDIYMLGKQGVSAPATAAAACFSGLSCANPDLPTAARKMFTCRNSCAATVWWPAP